MIRRFIRKLSEKLLPRPKPVVLDAAHYGITPDRISAGARRVCEVLQQHGHQGLVVGGAVRDLLLGRQPKDFDVATDAPPERVRALFRRARIIGRRFRIVHVYLGHETVEVTTFRGRIDPRSAATDAHGRLLEDNVFGTHEEDATRRDFTANALYYDPVKGVIHDFHHGVGDLAARTLRMIGNPEARYREDPVRMLRAVRLSAKLGLTIDSAARAPLRRLAPLLAHVPQARLVDEWIKVLTSGHALACLEQLQAEGLASYALAPLEKLFVNPHHRPFIETALRATDERVAAGKPVSVSFTLAALLWPAVHEAWQRRTAQGQPAVEALNAAIDEVLEGEFAPLAFTRALAGEMRELWLMQPRFVKRTGRYPYRFLAQPRYRAAWDFLALRARCGEVPQSLVEWWARFAAAGDEERAELIAAANRSDGEAPRKKRRRRRPRSHNGESTTSHRPAEAVQAGPSDRHEASTHHA